MKVGVRGSDRLQLNFTVREQFHQNACQTIVFVFELAMDFEIRGDVDDIGERPLAFVLTPKSHCRRPRFQSHQ